jgi:hypothetical protein
MATFNQIREAVRAQPFQPFILRLADGRSYQVNHPEFVAVSPNGRELLFVADDQGIHQIEMLLVLEIETPGQPTASAEGDGDRTS